MNLIDNCGDTEQKRQSISRSRIERPLAVTQSVTFKEPEISSLEIITTEIFRWSLFSN